MLQPQQATPQEVGQFSKMASFQKVLGAEKQVGALKYATPILRLACRQGENGFGVEDLGECVGERGQRSVVQGLV